MQASCFLVLICGWVIIHSTTWLHPPNNMFPFGLNLVYIQQLWNVPRDGQWVKCSYIDTDGKGPYRLYQFCVLLTSPGCPSWIVDILPVVLRLAIWLILNGREGELFVLLATVCSSWIHLNRGTSKRSQICPEGDRSRLYVRQANMMVSRILVLSIQKYCSICFMGGHKNVREPLYKKILAPILWTPLGPHAQVDHSPWSAWLSQRSPASGSLQGKAPPYISKDLPDLYAGGLQRRQLHDRATSVQLDALLFSLWMDGSTNQSALYAYGRWVNRSWCTYSHTPAHESWWKDFTTFSIKIWGVRNAVWNRIKAMVSGHLKR